MVEERREDGTVVLRVQPDLSGAGDRRLVERAGAILAGGGTVAFPTETVYGLGAHGLDPEAVGRVFDAKGRPRDNPLILHVAGPGDVEALVAEVPPAAERLMERFWPGPLTLVLPRSGKVPDAVTAGLDTVALRCPDHAVARALVEAAGGPLAAPSANRSGRPSPTRAEHVLQDLGGRVDAVLDGGPTGVGVESTVLDLSVEPPRVLRPGGVPLADLRRVHPAVMQGTQRDAGEEGAPRSPGMKYRHYAPGARLVLVVPEAPEGSDAAPWGDRELRWVLDRARELREAGEAVGVLVSRGTAERLRARAQGEPVDPRVEVLASWGDGDEAARRLFHALRRLDEDVDVILAEPVPEAGRGDAVMNRLRKAASDAVVVDAGG